MNLTADQLKAQTKAAFSACLDDPSTPLEGSRDGVSWHTIQTPYWYLEKHYRIQPFTLTRSINGHTLADGQAWHRSDFTRDMLPPPCRPLILGRDDGAYECSRNGQHWQSASNSGTLSAGDHGWFYRTTRPLPSVIAPGWNPAALTVAQVGEGWRLLDEDEHATWKAKNKRVPFTEYWSNPHWYCTTIEAGMWPGTEPLRTRLSRPELAALDAPKTRLWNCEQDIPFPWPILRHAAQPDKTSRVAIVSVSSSGFEYVVSGSVRFIKWADEKTIAQLEHTQDGKTFHPCTVPA